MNELRQKHVPWCTILLVSAAFMSQLCVLIGNFHTAGLLDDLGESTRGWSQVGVGVARSLHQELNLGMGNISSLLIQSLEQVTFVQDSLDGVLSTVGNATDSAISNSPALALLDLHGPKGGLMLLQEVDRSANLSNTVHALTPMIIHSVHEALESVMSEAKSLLRKLLDDLKPALAQIGAWLISFGSQVMEGIDIFTVTIDRVQKIFDQVMARLQGQGPNEEEMLKETFNLFDASHTGYVSEQDLRDVGSMYGITILEGTQAATLMKKYDADGNGELLLPDLRQLIHDSAIPGAMSVMLRSFAKELAKVSGEVSSARMRWEVALGLVHYFQVVAAKNDEAMRWIADRLGNESLPLAFTADVLAQLCLQRGNPSTFTTVDVGQRVVSELHATHPASLSKAIDLLSNTTFWESEGFDVNDEPRCLGLMTMWLNNATGPQMLLQEGEETFVEDRTVLAMPQVAHALAEEAVNLHLLQSQKGRASRQASLFKSRTSQMLRMRLLGGISPTESGSRRAVEQVQRSGQPAVPATLEFAQWLANNASAEVKRLQEMCFTYSSESSNALDSVATMLKGMTSQVKSFLQMMSVYATPDGIERLENQTEAFLENSVQDVIKLVETRLDALIIAAEPEVEGAIDSALKAAHEQLEHIAEKALAGPFGDAMAGPLENIMAKALGNNQTATIVSQKVGSGVGKAVADQIMEVGEDYLDELVNKVLKIGDAKKSSHLQMLQRGQSACLQEEADSQDTVSGVWQGMVTTLRGLTDVLPAAVHTLRSAQTEVAKLSSSLNSVFDTFEQRGPTLFQDLATTYRTIWLSYFLALLPMQMLLLFYSFWAGGFFGGPMPLSEETLEAPKTWKDQLRVCWVSSTLCLGRFHDTSLCAWSVILLMQILVLIVFAASIVLAILAAIKAFIVTGCGEIYILQDELVCGEALQNLRRFLSTFSLDPGSPSDSLCQSKGLLTCQLMGSQMARNSAVTAILSLIATVLTMQMIIDSAILHEQARYRRMVKMTMKDEPAEPAEPAEPKPS